ncbi:MBL fold metallo-hydrolase [Kordiimonas aquimaris]|uniref:MBL fold metallo-hydrolase n=1 Tax=Kordiimonas aquimaris TaxID=707591 RepID=UPI0021D1F3BB|nr:MBL fold metallo-hydrolase [Kordiimonas aquimaris]
MTFKTWAIRMGVAASMTALSVSALAQNNFDDVKITTQKLTDTVYVLFGAGGNIGVSVGEDGVFIIDDQFAPLTERIKAAIAELSDQPIRFAINTHFHGDHTGGNENLGKEGTVIVAHDNVRVRMSQSAFNRTFNRRSEAKPKAALPVVTFNDRASLHLNGDTARMHHVRRAHTDGDSIVEFEKDNVLHMGDTFFVGRFPFIDVDSGGTIDGVIGSTKTAIAIADDNTQVIPGHGPVTDREGLRAYLKMLEDSRDRVAKLKADGKTLDEIRAAKPLADYEETITGGGADWTNAYIGFVFNSL